MNIINQLLQKAGHYIGKGENHEGKKFKARFCLAPIINGAGIKINYETTGLNDDLLHKEETIIALNQNTRLSLWTLNSNVPYLYEHELTTCNDINSDIESKFIFRHNDPEDRARFREDIELILWENEMISYNYSWGLPNKDFTSRSKVNLYTN